MIKVVKVEHNRVVKRLSKNTFRALIKQRITFSDGVVSEVVRQDISADKMSVYGMSKGETTTTPIKHKIIPIDDIYNSKNIKAYIINKLPYDILPKDNSLEEHIRVFNKYGVNNFAEIVEYYLNSSIENEIELANKEYKNAVYNYKLKK